MKWINVNDKSITPKSHTPYLMFGKLNCHSPDKAIAQWCPHDNSWRAWDNCDQFFYTAEIDFYMDLYTIQEPTNDN